MVQMLFFYYLSCFTSKKSVFAFADLYGLLLCTHLGCGRDIRCATTVSGKWYQSQSSFCYFGPFVWRHCKTAKFFLENNFLLAIYDLLNCFFIWLPDIVPQVFSLFKKLLRLLLDMLHFRPNAPKFFLETCLFRKILPITISLLCFHCFLYHMRLMFCLG